jgi:hypothetical protein
MGDYLVQAIIFLAGIVIQLYTQILSPGGQKKALGVFSALLIGIALVWTGYQWAVRDIAKEADASEIAVAESPLVLPDEKEEPTPTERPVTPEQLPETPTKQPVPPTQRSDSDGNVWINSHPAGAEVFIVPATVDIYDLEIKDVQMPENSVGITPLSMDLSTGSYYVLTLFPAELFSELGVELPSYSSPGYDDAFPSDGSLVSSASFTGGEFIKDLSRLYQLRIDQGRTMALISLAFPLPVDQRYTTSPAIYPTLETVAFLPNSYNLNENGMRNAIESDLTKYNLTGTVKTEMVDDMIEVLKRVGKVYLKTDAVRFIIQLGGFEESTFTVSVYQ